MGNAIMFKQSIDDLFDTHYKNEKRLIIPNYQRPYKWTTKNICDLLNDIETSMLYADRYINDGFKYRLGTIILHKGDENNRCRIVDGQQRLISLLLIKKCLAEASNEEFCVDDYIELEEETQKVRGFSQISLYNIQQNYLYIKNYLNAKAEIKDKISEAMKNVLEVVVIYVSVLSEAFQLFDSQNSRGKALFPHDLLKAYHLREMQSDKLEMRRAVINWQKNKSYDIGTLFSTYLYRVLKWSRGESYKAFSSNDIDFYKGISESTGYNYAHRVDNAMPYFLINEPFISGGDFFKMVQHYLDLLSDVKEYLKSNEKDFENINRALKYANVYGTGYQHTCDLFYAALLFYYDKFKMIDPLAVQKIFKWAFSIRVYRARLGLDSINRHALGYSEVFNESINMFRIIANARIHTEISGVSMTIAQKNRKSNYYFEKVGNDKLIEFKV